MTNARKAAFATPGTLKVVDLHAIGFDPVFREHDGPNWIDDVRESLLDAAGNTVKRFLRSRPDFAAERDR